MGEVGPLEILVLVKAYPNPSESQGEACCVMGINRDLGFVRIYPIPFRNLEDDKQFGKYQRIRLGVQRPKNDSRPNTFRPQLDTLELLDAPIPSGKDWYARKQWVMPWVGQSMCGIIREQARSGLSMGMFKPAEVLDLTQEVDATGWAPKDLAKLGQRDLFLTKENKLLEKVPFKWRYKYRCSDPACPTHEQTIVDWELAALYLNLKWKGGDDPKAIHDAVRKKFLGQMCDRSRDVYFFTGNMGAHPGSFLILGVFWPPRDLQATLF